MSKPVELIKELLFDEAADAVVGFSLKELATLLVSMAHDQADIRPYSFVMSRLSLDANPQWHYLASLLLSQPLCHLKGAYETAYYHAKAAMELAPDDLTLKEYALFFYDIPDRLMSDADAAKICDEILAVDPNNETARSTLAEHKKRAEGN